MAPWPAPKFKDGDKVSWDIGSDRYTGIVKAANGVCVHVLSELNRLEKFTIRNNGEFKLMSYKFGTLTLGGESYRDPSY